jgi:DNA-binding Xre family transcriptional regulator
MIVRYGGGVIMGVSYKKLFHILIDRDISNAQLQQMAGYSANITTRLKNNTYVSLESIEKICRILDCGVDDILEFIPDEQS